MIFIHIILRFQILFNNYSIIPEYLIKRYRRSFSFRFLFVIEVFQRSSFSRCHV